MADILQDTDLLLVNRGGTNYKITGAQFKSGSVLQDTDLVMVQMDAQLYKVPVSDFRGNDTLADNDTYFLVQRGSGLFSIENPLGYLSTAAFTLDIDVNGLNSSDKAVEFNFTSATATPSGQAARFIFVDSSNQVVDSIYPTGTNTKQVLVSEFLTKYGATGKVIVVGVYRYISFQNSKGLTKCDFQGNWDKMFPQPLNMGLSMFQNCTSLTDVFGSTTMGGQAKAMTPTVFTSGNATFSGCSVFNADVSTWDTSGVTDMSSMFRSCGSFNKSLDAWDVGSVQNMSQMFNSSQSFDSSIATWQVGNVINFSAMFLGAFNYNKPLSTWDVYKASQQPGDQTGGNSPLSSMFSGAGAFVQDISTWCVANTPSEPFNFNFGGNIPAGNMPKWGDATASNCP